MDDHQNQIIKRFLIKNNDEFLVENFVTKDLILRWDNKDIFLIIAYHFVILFEKANLSMEDIVLNSFATSFYLYTINERLI